MKYPMVAKDHAKELSAELKLARGAAQNSIRKVQEKEKNHYDQRAKNTDLKEGDLVMLKVQPLDQSFRGPFKVESLTSTNAFI